MGRIARLATAGALLAGALLLGSSSTVFAHASLQSSTPASNSVLEESPTAIVLEFDDSIEVAVASVELFDGNGDAIAIDPPRQGDDDTIVTASVPALADGLYAVIWRVTSADGHPVDGSFSFQIGTSSSDVTGDELINQVRAGAHSPASVRWAYGIARFLSVLGAIALIGVGGWLLTGATAVGDRAIARRWCRVAAGVFLFGSAMAFALFGVQATAGSIGDAFDPSVWSKVAGVDTGRALLLRLVFAGALLALAIVWDRRSQGWWRGGAAAGSVLGLATFPLAGHPNSSHPRLLWFAVDLVHLGAIVVWIGGLFMLLLAGRELLAAARGERIARRFSATAAVCVPLIVATGVLQTWKLVGGFDDVAVTDWGRILLIKVTLVVVLLAVAGVSRWLLLHDGSSSIRRTVVVEAVVGVVVVALAAGMVGLPPTPVVAAQPFAARVVSEGMIVELSVGPGAVGRNELHVVITPPGGSIVPVIAAAARVALPDEAVPAAPVQLVAEGVNHYSGFVTFPRSGDWTLDVIIEVTPGQTVLVKRTVPIP
ncbi:MAG: copper resistance protein CopC [Actinomycetia bacterium]|nr:copper resistance protein CopC [Actinomycetes bacterium]